LLAIGEAEKRALAGLERKSQQKPHGSQTVSGKIPQHQLSWMKSIKDTFKAGVSPRPVQMRFTFAVSPLLNATRTALDYCYKPLNMWAPCSLWKALLPTCPCPKPDCSAKTILHGFTATPRIVQSLDDTEYLWASVHQCTVKEVDGKDHGYFNSDNAASLAKMPPFIQQQFAFHLTEQSCATNE